jgi:uncharacterized protein YecE (DUF72 family)
MTVWIGTSGWQYSDWRGRFYPRDLAQARWLEHYSVNFQTVEVNSAFYRLPDQKTFEQWKRVVPNDFIVALKASRYLTHIRRLRDPGEPVRRLLDRAQHLGAQLGPILLQLPPTFRVDVPALEHTLDQFPGHCRVTFEPRHPSWFTDSLADVLTRHNAALSLSDVRGPRGPLWRTADWGYLRLHEGRADPRPCYGTTALGTWATRLARLWKDDETVHAYFNNDHGGCAVRDAHRFASAVRRAGLTPSRVPSARQATLRLADS